MTLFPVSCKSRPVSRDGGGICSGQLPALLHPWTGVCGDRRERSGYSRELCSCGNKVAVTTVSFFLALLCACGGPAQTPEERIRDLVARAEQAAEDHDLSVFKDSVADDYRDSRGYNRQNILRLIQGMLLRNQQIHLLSLVREVQVQQDTARARVLVAMAGRPIESAEVLMDLRADLVRFDVEFLREGDEWRVRAVDWGRAEVVDFL